MTNIRVAVDRVYPSHFSFDTLTVTIPGGWIEGKGGMGSEGHRFHFTVGERALLFVAYDKRLGRYITHSQGEYIVTKSTIYIPEKRAKRVELDVSRIRSIIESNARRRELGRLVTESDIVVKGKIVGTSKSSYDLHVDKVYKGNVRKGIIQIACLPIGSEEYLSPRRAYSIGLWEVGATYIVFLKQIDELYLPFAGRSSSIRVEGDVLSINNIQLIYELDELERRIRRAHSP